MCYVALTKTIWIAAGTSDAPMYDPKSGDNVSDKLCLFYGVVLTQMLDWAASFSLGAIHKVCTLGRGEGGSG